MSTSHPPHRPHRPHEAYTARSGVVASFDDHVGAGTITDGETGDAWWFHCTRLADASRTVAVGAAVSYRVEPGPTGLEAVDVRVTAGPPPS